MKRMVNWLLTLLLFFSFNAVEAQSNYETVSDANFRKGPGTRFKSIGIIKAGEKVYAYDVTNPSWFKVEYNGQLGYISSKFLSQIMAPPVTLVTPAYDETESEKSDNSTFWVIAILIAIALFIFSRKKGKANIESSIQQSTQTQPVRTQGSVPSQKKLPKIETKVMSVINNQKLEDDPSIIDIKELDLDIKVSVVAESDYRSKEPIKSNPHEEKPYPINYINPDRITDEYDWGLGTKYKAKLHLTEEHVNILNRQWSASNNFCSIEFCCDEVVKLFISTLKSLNDTFLHENKTLNQQITTIVDTVLRKHFRFQLNSFNYKSSIESTTTEIYTTIFKYCENTVRNHYGHKRKLSTDTYFDSTTAAHTEFETGIITPLNKILPTLISTIALPDEETEIALNAQNTSRWKDKFEEISETYKDNSSVFLDHIIKLGALNIKNPSIENIFFEASKFIAKADKEISLILYTHYLYYDLKSASFDNKQLTKTIQKNIFKTNDQIKAFEIIISDLIQDKNLEKALKRIPDIFSVKRKKIKLDTKSIQEVQLQHSETVELLNEYLEDEYEDENNSIKTQQTGNDELTIQITSKSEVEQKSIYGENLIFSPIHIEVLEIFIKSNFSVIKKELETIIKPKGFFVNQVIENINEITYEFLDDILIEEDDDCLTINPLYYQRILAK